MKKQELRKRLRDGVILVSFATLSFLLIQWWYFEFDMQFLSSFVEQYTRLSILSIIIVLLLKLPLYFATGSSLISSLFVLGISCLVGFANYQKMLYRPEPIYPSDILMLKDFKFLFDSIEFTGKVAVIIILVMLCIILVFIVKKIITNFTNKKNVYLKTFLCILSLFVFLPVINFGKNNSLLKEIFEVYGETEWIVFNQESNYDRNGVIAGILYNISSHVIEKPENYSKVEALKIANHYKELAFKENTTRNGKLNDINIVFIMNESFADPMKFEGWSIFPDPLPNYREIIKGTSFGQVLSQGYGGGTANIEFEALTGISMEPLLPSISIAYTQLSDKMDRVPSFLQYLKQDTEENYFFTAIHPFQSGMYKRPEVYSNLGFNKIIFEEDMDFQEKLESSLYISDKSSYQQVFKEMDESIGKDFIHLVTMQGHGPYYVGYFGNLQGFEIEGPVKKMDMLNYLSSLSYSDDYLKYYVDQINQRDEKTITVFWGDHLPSAISYGITSINDPIKKYLTPVLIHSNFETPKNNMDIISPIYFVNEIIDKTNSKLTAYYSLLNELRKYLPAFEKEFHIFGDVGNIGTERIHNFDEDASRIMQDYEFLIYDIFEGKRYFEELDFFSIVN